MHVAVDDTGNGANAPGAGRMAAIAFLSFNLSMGCMYGPFGVLINPIEQRLGVSRNISTLAVPVVTFVIALLAPVVGSLAGRLSLRLMMVTGSLLMAAGFAVLAGAHSTVLFVGAYALLIGPGLSICGVVAPSTLVTRWFQVNRGRALGIATTPALMAATPLLATLVLAKFDLAVTYGMLAGLMLVCFAVSFFAVDHPALGMADRTSGLSCGQETQSPSFAMGKLFSDTIFWRLALAAGLYNAVIVMFSTQLVPFATGLGIDPTKAALLLTIYFVGTLVGTTLIGVFADKVGGARMIGFLCLSLALWQGLLLLQPGFVTIALLAGLAGLQGSAMISCLGLALSEHFGQSGFAKAWGMSNVVGLPFGVLSVPVASMIFVRTGSYNIAFILAVAGLVVGAVLALSIGRRNAAARTTVS